MIVNGRSNKTPIYLYNFWRKCLSGMGIATNDISLSELKAKVIEQERVSSKFPLTEIFSERNNSYLNEFTLFLAHFNAIPNSIEEESIDCKKANKWLAETYKRASLIKKSTRVDKS